MLREIAVEEILTNLGTFYSMYICAHLKL